MSNKKRFVLYLILLLVLAIAALAPTSAQDTPTPVSEAETDEPVFFGMEVEGEKWIVTANDISQTSRITSPFGDSYRVSRGSELLLVGITVENMEVPEDLPNADMLLSGVHFYSSDSAPDSAFSLEELLLISGDIESGDTEEFGLVAFGIGTDPREFLFAPNLTDFNAAFSGEEANFKLAFEVPSALLDTTFMLAFADYPLITLADAPSEAGSVTDNPDAVTIHGTVYASQENDIVIPGAEVELNDPDKEAEDPAYNIATTTTDDDGTYVFEDLEPGSYILSILWMTDDTPDIECNIDGMTFRGDWLVAPATNNQGETVIIAISDTFAEVEVGSVIEADLDLGCD